MVGVRFCGGCNPHYERREFYEKIKKHYEGRLEFELAREGVEYEGLMVLGGCSNCCAAYKQYTTKTVPALVWDKDHFDETVKKLDKLV